MVEVLYFCKTGHNIIGMLLDQVHIFSNIRAVNLTKRFQNLEKSKK